MEKAKKPFYLRWWFIGFCAIIILGLIVGPDEEESDKGGKVAAQNEPVPEPKKTTTKNPEPAKLDITESAKEMAIETTKEDSNVQDAAIAVKGGKISFAVIVGAAINEETAKDIGDNFVRQLSAFTDGSTPTKDYYGELYDQYDVLITVGDSAQNVIVQGAKVKGAKKITW